MTNANELHDLRERIARLSLGDQLLVLESVLAEIRKLHFTDHAAIRQELAAAEEWYAHQKPGVGGLSGEAKREAG